MPERAPLKVDQSDGSRYARPLVGHPRVIRRVEQAEEIARPAEVPVRELFPEKVNRPFDDTTKGLLIAGTERDLRTLVVRLLPFRSADLPVPIVDGKEGIS